MFEKLTSWNNLLLAWQKASKGKRGHGNVAAFEHHMEDHLLDLQAELQTRTYQPGAYASFYIHEPKRRLISAAPFRDRVVHHALCNLIEPIFERSFIFDSYANRIGKGTHRALNRAQEFSRRYPYVLQCDIRQFFPSIDHELLRATLGQKISDPAVLWLCDQILASGSGVLAEEYEMNWFDGDTLFSAARPRGLPIGNLTSQFWANVFLNPFDHFVKRKLGCAAYLRFVDDTLLFARDKQTLWDWLREIKLRMGHMRLTIHPNAAPHPVSEGFTFLGFQVFPQQRRLKRSKGIYYQRKLCALLNDYAEQRISLDQLSASVQGWTNHVRFGNTIGLRKSIFGKTIIPPVTKET